MRVLSAALWGLVLGFVAAAPAAAYEDKITLGAGAGYALAPASSSAPHGAAFDAQAGLGLGVEWQLRGGLTYALHPAKRAVHVGLARAELVYLVDIVDLVPFGGLGVGARLVDAGGGSSALDFAAHGVIGVAYWISFDALLELDVRAHLLPGRLSTEAVYLVSGLSFIWAFER